MDLRRVAGRVLWARAPAKVAPFDLVLAALVITIAEAEIWLPPDGCLGGQFPFGLCNFGASLAPPAVAVVSTTASALALLARRRWPLQVLGSIGAVSAIVALAWVASPGLGYFLPMVIAAYSVGRYHRSRHPSLTLLGAAVFLFAISVIHDLRVPGQSPNGSLATFYVVLIGALPMGRALQAGDLRAELARAEAREARLAQEASARDAVEEERARIARELHDVAAHGASLIVVQSVAAQGVFESDPARGRAALESIESEARTMLAEMRSLVAGIRPASSPSDGASHARRTLEQLVARVRDAGQPVEARFETDLPLRDDLELSVYRCVQEALTNAVKHAPGVPTTVVAGCAGGHVEIEVENGPPLQTRGHGAAPQLGDGGFGLPGMRERVAALGGSLTAGPTPGGGFRVRLSIPVGGGAT